MNTGVLESEHFVIGAGARIDYMIGGGAHPFPSGAPVEEGFVQTPDICAVALEVLDARSGTWSRAFSAPGHNADNMSEESWDASAFAGQTARYRIYDTHDHGWGHIAVDHIRCSSCGPTANAHAGWTRTSPGCVLGHNAR